MKTLDKEEFRIKLEEINKLVQKKDYKGAMGIVDSIDWRRVKNVRTLCVVGEIYAANGRYEDSKEIFLLAYHKASIGKNILYRLIEISLRMKDIDEAMEFFEEYKQVASNDSTQYILQYKIARAQDASLNEQIRILEEYKEQEFTEKWSYELNRTKGSWGSYYAGQSVIVDDYLYATGGGNLHKVDTKTGKGETVAVAGSTAFYYDYVAYGDGMIFVSTSNDIEAFDIDTLQSLGKVKGTFSQYHPMQYNKGYLVCNGNIYKVNKNSDNVLTQVGEGTIGGDSFNWSQGVFANNYYYVVATNDIYCVDYKTNTIKYQYKYDENRTTTFNIGGELAYDSTTDYLYWGSYKQKNLHAVKLNDNGDFDKETYKSATISQETVCAPVVYNNRIYVAGQGGTIDVINGNPDDNDFLSTIYTTNKIGMKIQSNPILSTGYEEETGNVYIYVQSYNAPGNIYYLEDNENSTSGELKQLSNLSTTSTAAYAYEQIAIDDEGQIYFFNEEGYLYCYGEKHIHNYTYETLLNGKHIKTCDGCGESEEEFCTFENDKCIYCGVERSKYIYGDINQDGEVTVQDTTLLQKYVTKLAELNDVQKECAMFDHMDKITVKSATKIQKYIANPELDTLIGASFYMYSK